MHFIWKLDERDLEIQMSIEATPMRGLTGGNMHIPIYILQLTPAQRASLRCRARQSAREAGIPAHVWTKWRRSDPVGKDQLMSFDPERECQAIRAANPAYGEPARATRAFVGVRLPALIEAMNCASTSRDLPTLTAIERELSLRKSRRARSLASAAKHVVNAATGSHGGTDTHARDFEPATLCKPEDR